MSDQPSPRPPPPAPLVFESQLIRIEGYTSLLTDTSVDWDVNYAPAFSIADGRRVLVSSGYLHIPGPYWGQAVVLGRLVVGSEFDHMSSDEIAAKLLPGYVENMYDVGRRAINMLAGLMDGPTPALPTQSPSTEIEPAPEPLEGLDGSDGETLPDSRDATV